MNFGQPHCYFDEPPLRLIKEPVCLLKGWIRTPSPPVNVTLEIAGRPQRLKLSERPDLFNAFPTEWARGFKTVIDTVRFAPKAREFSLPWRFVADGKVWEEGMIHIPKPLLDDPAPLGMTAFEREAKAMWVRFDIEPMAWLDHPNDRVLRPDTAVGGWVRVLPGCDTWTIEFNGRAYPVEIYRRPDVEDSLQLPGRIDAFWAFPKPSDFPGEQALDWAILLDGAEVHGGILQIAR